MKLKKQREDVRLLTDSWASHGGSPVFVDIAKRYLNLIRAFECGKPILKLRYIKRVLKDAEVKK